MKKKILPVLVVFALIILVIGIAGISALVKKYTPSKEKKDLKEYYNITTDDEAAIVLNNEILEQKAKYVDGHVFLEYTFLHDTLNSRFYWDYNEKILFYSTDSEIISAASDSTKYLINKSTNDFEQTIVIAADDTAYINIDFAKQYSDFKFKTFKKPNRVVITNQWGEYEVATVKQESNVRLRGGIKSPILTTLERKDTVTVLDTTENWSKVITKNGIIGYIKNRNISDTETKKSKSDYKEEKFTHITKDKKICMAWHQMLYRGGNADISRVLASTKGVNVISPTWFYLNDNEGNIANLASSDYVSYCHSHGVEVWALVSNLENKDVDTTKVLTNSSIRHNLVNQLIATAINYNLDGINVDFEAMNGPDVEDSFIQFIRELSVKCGNNGIVLSVDNYVPAGYNSFYRRAEQANFADYVIIMGYDEHYSNSDPGSVASLPWVTQGVVDTLKEVPAEQVILGMPFYTRVWVENPNDDNNTESTVTSSFYGMTSAASLLSQNGVTPEWSETDGQNFATWESNGCTYQVWLEDSASAEKRLELVDQYSLAGASFWKLGFESYSIWDTINKYLSK